MDSRRYLITGRVQGVGYRAFARRAARGLELAGWVGNRADGGVDLVAVGPAAALDALEALLRQGPAAAAVAVLTRQSSPADAELAGGEFEIRYG
jgi:acylphosphatase